MSGLLSPLEPGAVPKHIRVKAALAARCRTMLGPGDTLASARGLTPSSRTIATELVRALAAVTAFFGSHPGRALWHVNRVRLADGERMAFEDCWYNVVLAPDLASARCLHNPLPLRSPKGPPS